MIEWIADNYMVLSIIGVFMAFVSGVGILFSRGKAYARADGVQRRYDDLKQLHQTMLDQSANKIKDLIAERDEILTAIRAYCDETDPVDEGRLSAALRQYVCNDADVEAIIAEEGCER